ncbi:MAG: hypothetical protein AB7F19_02340 [Candidatus Babeliales bacterium]
MNKKNVIWYRVKNKVYRRAEYHDETMATLSLFFEDGLDFPTYIDFLKDPSENILFGNICILKKNGKMVSVSISDYIFPGLPSLITTIENLIKIINEYDRLEDLEVARIEISFDELDQVTIRGG